MSEVSVGDRSFDGLDLRLFLLGGFFPIRTPEEVRSEVFHLCYGIPGFAFPVNELTPEDRDHFLRLLCDRLEMENKARREATAKIQG
jgi:hypothetical protein